MFSDIKHVAITILKLEQNYFTMQKGVQKMKMEWQTVKTLIRLLLDEQSDLGLHCLHMSDRPKT